MLPFAFICLLQASLGALAQQIPRQLSLNQVVSINKTSLPNPPVFILPPSSNDISVSVALCSSSGPSSPRSILSNDTSLTQLSPSDVGQPNVFELSLGEDGFGNWTGLAPQGGFLAISGAGQMPFEVGVSDQGMFLGLASIMCCETVAFEGLVGTSPNIRSLNHQLSVAKDPLSMTLRSALPADIHIFVLGPIHTTLDEFPLLGDTTSNQVLLFSPPFSPPSRDRPTYPNYSLPSANLSFPTGPSSPLNYTLYFTTTSSSSLTSHPRTGCALRALRGPTYFNEDATASDGLWLKDEQGWRWQWLIGGLSPTTNYTAFAILEGTKVSQPINFVTKSGRSPTP